MGRKRKMKLVVYENLDLGYRYIADRDGNIYDTATQSIVKYNDSCSHKYLSCYLRDVNGKVHQLLVHRVIACTWICDTTGKQVHHKNHKRTDPRVKNLEVLDTHDHCIKHNRGSHNNTAKFKEKDVHQICKWLKKGITHKEIARRMTDSLGVKITVDAIDKISNGSNWKQISSQYDLKVEPRETMGEFADKCVLIGQMRYDGKSTEEIAEALGVMPGTKSYRRLAAVVKRYHDNYASGKYGLFRRQ